MLRSCNWYAKIPNVCPELIPDSHQQRKKDSTCRSHHPTRRVNGAINSATTGNNAALACTLNTKLPFMNPATICPTSSKLHADLLMTGTATSFFGKKPS